VKFLQLLLNCLVLALIVVVLFSAVIFLPFVQARLAQAVLDRHPDLHGSVDSFHVSWGQVQAGNLHLEPPGAVLDLPSVEARLPVLATVRSRQVRLQRLVAKGWTLDLSGRTAGGGGLARYRPVTPGSSAGPAGAQARLQAARVFRGLLSSWHLPCDLAVEGLELEGDVILAAAPYRPPVTVHVVLSGGGLAAGREGTLSLDASMTEAWLQASTLKAHATLVVAMDSPRTVRRVTVQGTAAAAGGGLPEAVSLAVAGSVTRESDAENYQLTLGRGSRHLLTLAARLPLASGLLGGNWQIDARDPDLRPFLLGRPLPAFEATGAGSFATNGDFSQANARGQLHATIAHWGELAPTLDRFGPLALAATFAGARDASAVRLDRLEVELGSPHPLARLEALQPFSYDLSFHGLVVPHPGMDFVHATIRALPLAWLAGLTGRVDLQGGDVAGEVMIRAAAGGFAGRTLTPLTATAVTVAREGRILGRGLDVSLVLSADDGPDGWHAEAAPLALRSGGRAVATITGKASRDAGDGQPLVTSGTWQGDLHAWAAQPALADAGWLSGHTASGDFSASFGDATVVDAKVAVVGDDPARSVSASVEASVDADGQIKFLAPIKTVTGSLTSDLAADGVLERDSAGRRLEVRLTGENVALEHLGLLARPLAALGGAPRPGAPAAPAPFWGDWTGRITMEFDHLAAMGRTFAGVYGVLEAEPGKLQLENGHGSLPDRTLAHAEGTVTFDAARAAPYLLEGVTRLDRVDASSLWSTAAGQDPVVEGHFAVERRLTASGQNFADLRAGAREAYHITGENGIIRFLRTSVADSIPEVSSPMRDALGSVGSAVGNFLEIKPKADGIGGKNYVSPVAEAVMVFTTEVAEIGYDHADVTAVRGADQRVRITAFNLTSADEHLTGTGEISPLPGRPLSARPLVFDLQFGARGQLAELLAKAGLMSTRKDALGYGLLVQPVRLGGTLQQIDVTAWHDLLAQAATRPGPGAKKGGKPPP
jgi:hypothetical protein